MADFAYWLESHMPILIRAALAELSQDETQQSQAQQSVTEFFESVLDAVRINDPQPIYTVLDAWVDARSAPTEGELTRLLPVMMAFKQVNAAFAAGIVGVPSLTELKLNLRDRSVEGETPQTFVVRADGGDRVAADLERFDAMTEGDASQIPFAGCFTIDGQ